MKRRVELPPDGEMIARVAALFRQGNIGETGSGARVFLGPGPALRFSCKGLTLAATGGRLGGIGRKKSLLRVENLGPGTLGLRIAASPEWLECSWKESRAGAVVLPGYQAAHIWLKSRKPSAMNHGSLVLSLLESDDPGDFWTLEIGRAEEKEDGAASEEELGEPPGREEGVPDRPMEGAKDASSQPEGDEEISSPPAGAGPEEAAADWGEPESAAGEEEESQAWEQDAEVLEPEWEERPPRVEVRVGGDAGPELWFACECLMLSPPSEQRCPRCGSPLGEGLVKRPEEGLRCPDCGRLFLPGANYCPWHGKELLQPEKPAARILM